MTLKYNPKKIERKWQRIWEENEIYKTPDRVKGKKNFYCLEMFPYPSGEGLHVGHVRNYIGADVIARFYRLKGFNVLHPVGFDAFGLPAENAAIKRGIHPRTWTYRNIKKMIKQLKALGKMYDWSREVTACEPDYYKWTQWMFLQLYKKGLAYRLKTPANWCPSCKTVLANEQVIDGRCERCDSQVIQRNIEQWLFKITAYAEDLLKGLADLNWPETTKIGQKNWIGKSEGWTIKFQISQPAAGQPQAGNVSIPVFTTRTDTLFGCTYLVIAPEHPIIESLKSQISNFKFVDKYIKGAKKKTERERITEVKEKTGIKLRGILAINPVNGREIPIFVADYVLMHYGTGAIMAVPAHDQRDFDFAKRYNLPIIEAIKPKVSQTRYLNKAFEEEGILVNSGRFSGMPSVNARERIGKWLAKKGLAERAVYYRLRDWLISRQRYWGAPIPMIYCQKCGWQAVKEKDLPVLLPNIRDFKPTGQGKSPLAKSKKFVETICPKCKGPAQRETDTMDTFVCSSWYYFRYVDPKNEKKFASKGKIKKWLPVKMYIGGREHTTGHLLYSRFLTKVLKDLGYIDFDEPFLRLCHQGVILGPDHQKMSKSKGNIIVPEDVIKKYGVDTFRLYEMFMGPFSDTMPWDPKGIQGCYRFLQRVRKLVQSVKNKNQAIIENKEIKRLTHQTIKKVTEDIENFRFNTAIAALMILVNELIKKDSNPPATLPTKGGAPEKNTKKALKILLQLLSPFAPHLTEELWEQLGFYGGIHNQKWPKYLPKLIQEKMITLVVQVNGKIRDKIEVGADITEEEAKELALSQEKIIKWIKGKKIKKTIFIPGKLINFVVV